ncbi:hypothetical protein AUC61_08730 [Pseudomonas sp. S25]|uniref:Uncharacterized protein n=1 Tax=Pseudomonas maioricensis TaxID=1766623 RepID=A0ABS9ZG96_9PSED|nr:hypothetical protein [Pseudomonas sp. S25]MCI8209619.1 hypothetical protein [Pseudomonas sp. S25]
MNLTFIIDQNHSYRRAIEIAYEKAKSNGGVDEITARECEFVLSQPEPDYVYDEVRFANTLRLHEGCVCPCAALNPWDAYEHSKIDARRRAVECVATQMDSIWLDVKKTAVGVDPELLNELSFSIDETGTIRPVSILRPIDAKAEKQLFELLNEHSEFKKAAEDYVWMLAGLVGRTIEGLSGDYARHFTHSCLREG